MPLPLLPLLANAATSIGKSSVGKLVGGLAKGTAEKGFRTAAGKAITDLSPRSQKILKAGAFATGALTSSMKQLNSSLKNFMQVNERLAVVNSNFRKEYSKNSDALHGAEQGFGLAAKAMTEFRVLGFKNSSKGMLDLATRMKISGQDTGKMMKTFQGLLGKGGVNEKNLGGLAETITQTSLRYGVTTDGLIGALDNLSSSLLDSNLTGGTAAIAETTVKLVGLVGEANAGAASQFIKLVNSSKKEQIDITSRLGIESFGDMINKGIVPSLTQIKDAISKASNATRKMVGEEGAAGQRRTIDALRGVMGETGPLGVLLHKAIGINQPKEVGVMDSIKNTFEHLKATFLAPFQIALAEMGPAFKTLTKSLFMFGGSLLNLVGSFSPVLVVIMDVVSAILRVFAVIFQAISSVVNAVMVVLSPLSSAWNAFVGRDKEDAPTMGLKKLEADSKSMGKIFGIESNTESIVRSNTELSKSISVTSQNYITHSKKTILGDSPSRRLMSAVDSMSESLENISKLEEEKKTRLIKQDMLDTKLSNKDTDSRLFRIADLAARESSGSWDHYARSMARDINLLVQPTIDTSRNTVPQPITTPWGAPNKGK